MAVAQRNVWEMAETGTMIEVRSTKYEVRSTKYGVRSTGGLRERDCAYFFT